MSPQISEKDWKGDEQVVYLTYREMAVQVMVMKQAIASSGNEAPELVEVLEGAIAKYMVELRPVLYDHEIESLGLE